MEDVFYTYFTDARHVVDINQAADITPYVKDLKGYSHHPAAAARHLHRRRQDLRHPAHRLLDGPDLQQGALRRRPDSTPTSPRPPGTRCAPTPGRSPHSATAPSATPTTSRRTRAAGTSPPSSTRRAATSSATTARRRQSTPPRDRAVLQNLKDMRWKDDAMGSKQLLVINDVQQMMGAGQARHVPLRARQHPDPRQGEGRQLQGPRPRTRCPAARAPSSAATATCSTRRTRPRRSGRA